MTNLVKIGALELRFLIEEAHGQEELVMFELLVPPNARVPAPHFHEWVDEAVYGLEGTLTTTVDGQRHEVRKGDVVFIPRGRVHQHENLHQDNARALTVLTPGSIGRSISKKLRRK